MCLLQQKTFVGFEKSKVKSCTAVMWWLMGTSESAVVGSIPATFFLMRYRVIKGILKEEKKPDEGDLLLGAKQEIDGSDKNVPTG